jgi:beta-galactosidase
MHQAYGYVMYESHFDEALHAKLSTTGMTDYALIYVNDSLVATIDRNMLVGSVPGTILLDIPKNALLHILVENMGRVNFGNKLNDNARGITKGIRINGKNVDRCAYLKMPLNTVPEFHSLPAYHANQPVFYAATFTLTHTADTYLDMHGFGKGVVFINGHNLGRYWEIGPQFSLYVPGVWLRKGANQIMIFDQLNHSQQHSISATAKPVNR